MKTGIKNPFMRTCGVIALVLILYLVSQRLGGILDKIIIDTENSL